MAKSTPRLAALARALQPAIMVFAAAAVAVVLVLGVRLRGELQAFQEEPVDNIHWNVTQLELDAVRFESEVELTQLDPNRSLTELRKRFDLFYSRAQSAIKGKMFDQLGLQVVVAPMNLRVEDFLTTTTPVIDSSDADLRASLPAISQQATALREDLRDMSVKIVDKYAALADMRRAAFTALVRQVAWASGIVLMALILMNALVLWLNRLAERRAAETARLSSRLAATVGTSLDAIIVAGMDGRIIDFNAAAMQIFGYMPDEAIGATLSELIIPPIQRAGHEAGMTRMKRYGSFRVVNSGRFEMTAMRKAGAEFPVELSIASHNTDDGMIFIAFLRDISARVAAERSLLAARDDALAAEQAKTNFMAVMSHEMRTPLNGVMAALEIASGMAVDDKQKRFLDLAESSARQLLRHANDVLDISKIEAGKMHLTLEDFDMVEMLQDFVSTLGHVAGETGTILTLDVLSDLPRLHGDAFRIGQIVQNFLSNAIKFTDQGQIGVEVEEQQRSDTTSIIEVRVTDSGIGIAEVDQERVFDDFVMVDPSYGRTGQGTGLGLAISRRLARAMGGEVGVESELGEGSCFWMRLPLEIAADQGIKAIDAAILTEKPSSLDVLVVEDNATNRIVLEEMLLQLGHRVSLAEDGGKGMELARAHHFDVILMDISMPLMDGLTSTALIRMDGQSRTSRIIAVTAHSLPADLERFRDAGMDGCLTKPITVRDLRGVLTAELTQPQPARPETYGALSLERLQDLREGLGAPGLSRMIERYLSDFADLQERLRAASTPEGAIHLMAVCHEGAGASAMVGTVALHRLFVEAEDLCRSGDVASAADLIREKTAPLWADAEAALKAYTAKAAKGFSR